METLLSPLSISEQTPLLEVHLFADLPESAQTELLQKARLRTYAKGAVVINEGDPAQALFIVCSGALKACLSDDQGKELILSTLKTGDYFGELALLDGEPRSANVVALEASQLLVLTNEAFQEVLQSHPDCLWQIVLNLVKQIRHLSESARTLALVDVFGRLARRLMELSEPQEGTDMRTITPRPTQQDIANQIGASREMVSRILKDLVVGGYLSLERDHMVIHRKFPSRW
jgi:CRP/FNR family transcriptional regulator, cyclic AMP receptor protein